MTHRTAFVITCFLSLWLLLSGRMLQAQDIDAPAGAASAVSDAGADALVEPAAPPDAAAAAASIAKLDRFMLDVMNFRAKFEQTLYDEASEPMQESSGTVVLQRPGRFDWRYDPGTGTSAGQRIVADGERVWIYDPDLEQVTVNRIDERVGGTPLVVLMGSAPLEDTFDITPLGESEGIDWLQMIPKDGGTDFESVYLGLDGDALAAMELRDSFGQATQIRFTDFEENVALPDDAFEFEVPEGVDVIGAEE